MRNLITLALICACSLSLFTACSAANKPTNANAPGAQAKIENDGAATKQAPELPVFNVYPTTSHGENIHPAYARLDASIPPAKVAITFVPTLHGKLAPEYLWAISGVFHHDLWGSDYVAPGTAMFDQGGGRYSTRARAYAEYGSGWRVLYWVLGQKQVVRGPELEPNQEGVVDFGPVEVKIENFLAGRVLCKGKVLHASGTPLDPALIGGMSFRAHIARQNCPDFEEGVSATLSPDGSFKFAIPFEPDTYRKSRTLTLEEIRGATLSSDFGGAWRVVGERDGVLDFGTQTIGGELVDLEVKLKLVAPFHWSDMPAPKGGIAIDAIVSGVDWARFKLESNSGHGVRYADTSYLGQGRFGARIFCHNLDYTPSASVMNDGKTRIEERAAPIKADSFPREPICFEVEIPDFWKLYNSSDWPREREYDDRDSYHRFASSPIRVRLDANGATLPEGAELQLSVGKWSDFRQSIRFSDGKFEAITLSRSLEVFPDNDGSIDLFVVDQNARWGFPYGPLCERLEVKSLSSPQDVTLKLTAKPEFLGPIEGPFSFKAYCGGVRCELPWSVKLTGEEVSARDLWRKLDAIEGSLYPYYVGDWGNKEKKFQIKRTGPTSYRVDVDASREVTISHAYFERFEDVWLEFGIGGRKVRFWPKHGGTILVPDFVEDFRVSIGGSLFGQGYQFESREVPSRPSAIAFSTPPTIVHTKGIKEYREWRLRSLGSSKGYSLGDYTGTWRAILHGNYQLWFWHEEMGVVVGEDVEIPDQDTIFELQVPKDPLERFTGEVRFQLSKESKAQLAKGTLHAQVRTMPISERASFGSLYYGANIGAEAEARIDGETLLIVGLPTEQEFALDLLVKMEFSELAAPTIRLNIKQDTPLEAGELPTFLAVVPLCGLPGISLGSPKEWRGWLDPRDFDRDLLFSIILDGKTLDRRNGVFVGQEHELWVWKATNQAAAPDLVIPFTPKTRASDPPERMGWPPRVLERFQPLLKELEKADGR